MFKIKTLALVILLSTVSLYSQDRQRSTSFIDQVDVSVGRSRGPVEGIPMPHPYHVEARHWPAGCEQAREYYLANFNNYGTLSSDSANVSNWENLIPSYCGAKFSNYDGENLVTSAGQTAISQAIANTSAQPASANYVGLTNTAITAAVGDTTLSSELNNANGGGRAQATFTDTSAAIGTNPTPNAPTTVGTTGAGTPSYWIVPCTYQGCTSITAATGVAMTTSNTTLTTANYNVITWTGKVGAAYYRVIRTHNATTPSGSLAGGSTFASSDGEVSNTAFCTDLVAGTAPTCTIYDQSNTLTVFSVPVSDQTFVGKFTLTKTFTATNAGFSAQAFGIFNASSSGTMYFEGTFTQATLVAGDTLAFTETIYH